MSVHAYPYWHFVPVVFARKAQRADISEGKELDLPVPPRCRDRVYSLYLPASSFPAPGDPNSFTPSIEE